MPQAVLTKEDGFNRLAITVDMLEAMVASGTIEDPGRVELIEGEMVQLGFVSRREGRLKAALLTQLSNQISSDFEVLGRVSVRLDDYNEPTPDICIAKAGVETNVLAPSDCALIIEVSEATARKDRIIKAPLYAKAGIVELWIVDLTTSETIVHCGPTVSGWSDMRAVPFASALVPLFDSAIKVSISTL